MFRRRPLLMLAAALAAVGCQRPREWQRPDWRPEQQPARIVAASVLAAESLVDLVPSERLAGVHAFAADPGYSLVADRAAQLHLLGATPEALLSVEPDLVLVDAYTRAETVDLLAMAGVPVVRTIDPHGFADIEANLRTFGRVTRLEDACEAVIERMNDQLADIRRRARELAKWRVLCLDGALHTHGRGSLFDAAVSAAGAHNVAAEHGVGAFRKLDIEEVLAWNPDAIVLSARGDRPGPPEWLHQYPGLDLLTCVEKERLLFVPGPMLSTTSHRLADTAAWIQRTLRQWGTP